MDSPAFQFFNQNTHLTNLSPNSYLPFVRFTQSLIFILQRPSVESPFYFLSSRDAVMHDG